MNALDKEQDKQDISRVLAGNREAFEGLVRRHEANVRGLCLSILQDAAEADDAAQEVFWKTYKSLKSFREEAAFSTWVHRIAVRHCLDVKRGQKRRRAESLDLLIEQGMDPAETARPAVEARNELAKVLSELAPEYRTVLVLRESEGYTYEEIAEAMSTSLDSVKARLRRAREALREAARHFLPETLVQKTEEQ